MKQPSIVLKFKNVFIFIVITFCCLTNVNAQKIDSLLTTLQFTTDTFTKLEIYSKVADYYSKNRNFNEAEKFYIYAKNLADSQSDVVKKISTRNALGVFYRNLSKYSESLKLHNEALLIATSLNNKAQLAKTLNNIGVVYRRFDDRSKAAEYHLHALKIAEEIKDTFSISVSENSLGNIYSLNGNYEQGLVYYLKALELAKRQKNLLGQAINYNNIGEVYEFSGDFDKAKEYYTKSYEINKQINNEKGIGISLNAIGKILLYTGFPKTAHKYFTEASVIDKKLGDKKFITDSYVNLGKALIALNRVKEAEQCLYQGIKTALECKSKSHLQDAYNELSKVYYSNKNFSKALEYYKISNFYKDSILNEKNATQLAILQTIYETEKKEKENQILKQNQELADKENKRQKYSIYSLTFGLIICIALVVVIYLALLSKRRANRLLLLQKQEIELQNHKIEQQKHNIEVKNRNIEEAYQIIENYIGKITDSIRYAEQIQNSILPDIENLKNIFQDTFTYYRPKDIVSGDFYWYTIKGDKVFVALADCTGHGVPGAFMSIIGIDLLNQVIIQQSCEEPEKILSFLNNELREKLRKGKDELILKDSMDIALCIINTKTREIEYSGALIPLFIVSDQGVKEIKPNYASLGAANSFFNKSFKVHKFYLEPNSWIYLTTDGYTDQFGGEYNKKFMRSHFVELLLSVNDYPAYVQNEMFEKQFNTWMGDREQVDDVLVWGIKV